MDYIGISQLLRGIIVIISFSFGLWITKDIVIAILAMYPACLLVTLLYDIPHARRLAQIKPRLLPKQGRTLLVKYLPLVLEILFLSMVVSVARQ